MLRIAKSSPGILDLSAVKDEFGLPVTLNGESHRDVPDHEEDNPVLQRVRDMQWVTVTRLPVEASTSGEPPSSGTVPETKTEGEPPSPGTVPETKTEDEPTPPATAPPVETEEVAVVASEQPSDTIDDTAKVEPGKTISKSDSRKAGRRP
jgi:hypothetical protein